MTENTAVTEIQTHTQTEKQAAGHLWMIPCYSAAVLESVNGSKYRSGLKKPQRKISVFILHLIAQGMSPGWSNVKASLALD